MKVGFTGTQGGMTAYQKNDVRQLLLHLAATELHHGDCVGSDADAHGIAQELSLRIVSHPPTNKSKRAFCVANIERDPYPYLERNHRIVHESDVLIATPRTFNEYIRSGTWATVRYARKQNKPIYIIWPHEMGGRQ